MGHRRTLAVNLLVLLAACSKGESNSATSTPPQPLTVSVSAARVKADGVATVNVTVSGGTRSPILLSTSGGTFGDGSIAAAIDGTAGKVTLKTCDARQNSSCAGEVRITAQDGNWAKGYAFVQFYGAETVCNDGKDDNGDGRTDCADSDCDQKVCSINGTPGTCQGAACVAAVCSPSGQESGTTSCSDGVDNNCDGRVDCADSACDGAPCKPGSPLFTCHTGQCIEQTTGYGLSLAPSRTRMPADGTAVAPVAIRVTAGEAAAPGVAITVTASSGALGATSDVGSDTTVDAVTDTTGTATVYFKAPAVATRAVLTAKLQAQPQISQTAAIEMPRLGAIKVARVQFPVMGARYSGVNEQNKLTVVLLDTENRPYPDGLAVRFQHAQLGGTELSRPWAPDTDTCKGPAASGTCIAYVGSTASPADASDTLGEASVNLYSGTLAGSVSVTASATAGGTSLTYTPPSVAITGAKVSGAHMSVDCSPKNVPAFTDSDCRKSYYDGPGSTITCTAYLADRYDNVLGLPEYVAFRAENGASSPPSASAAYDASKGGGEQGTLGNATGFIAVTGYNLPVDVTPGLVEVSTQSDLGCGFGTTTQNPRDGFVTVIAMARGEEGFVDGSNGMPANGKYDVGENFIDLGEPFVDANDNNTWDEGEQFEDLNGNGVWDGPNGVWDADTLLWAETRIVYTGFAEANAPYSGVSWIGTTPTLKSSANGQTATSADATFSFRDRWFNPPAPAQTGYAAVPWYEVVTVKMLEPPEAVDRLPAYYTQRYCQSPGVSATNACANRCEWAPCYAMTQLTGFDDFKAVGTLRVTGGAKPGEDDVRPSATVNGVKTTLTTALHVVAQ